MPDSDQNIKIRSADKYFSYIAKAFPVMCASGNFPVFPPVADATLWLDRYDDLASKSIDKHCTKLQRFHNDFIAYEAKASTFHEKSIARSLALNVDAVITELTLNRPWQNSPALYLQIAFTGLGHAATIPSKNEQSRSKRFIKRLRSIPAFFKVAFQNIDAVQPNDRALAQTMIRDCAKYLTEIGESDLGKMGKTPRFLSEVFAVLRDYDRFITSLPEISENTGAGFADITEKIFGTQKTAHEIFIIAEAEYTHRKASLSWLESQLETTWQEALNHVQEPEEEAMDVVIQKIHQLRDFTYTKAFPKIFQETNLKISPPPQYLTSTLRPIHYDPAPGVTTDAHSRCFVSQQLFTGRGFRDDPAQLKRHKREYLFMTARQTYPGRHFLDSQRRTLEESPMAQIVNPLFVEGWLAFSENLLDEMGYLTPPLDRLVHHQRGLTQAALAMVDAKLAENEFDQEQCLEMLQGVGFSKEEALTQVRTIRLKPASRIAPVLGLYEIKALREQSKLNTEQFCAQILRYGQLRFQDINHLLS